MHIVFIGYTYVILVMAAPSASLLKAVTLALVLVVLPFSPLAWLGCKRRNAPGA